jgi:hypothetical protein
MGRVITMAATLPLAWLVLGAVALSLPVATFVLSIMVLSLS